MTVTASSRDPDGLLLQTQITSLTSQIAATSSSLTKNSMSLKLDQLQRELVAVISKYVSINQQDIKVNLERSKLCMSLGEGDGDFRSICHKYLRPKVRVHTRYPGQIPPGTAGDVHVSGTVLK